MNTEQLKASAMVEASSEASTYQDALQTVKDLVIATSEDFAFASDLARGAQTNWRRLETRRTDITKPLLDSKRQIDALFKPALHALEGIKAQLQAKIGAYVQAQQAAQVVEMQASADQFSAGLVPTNSIPEVDTAKGISVKSHWVADVIDPDLVPRDLCSPDPAKIAQKIWYADTYNPPLAIPGLAFRLQTDVTVRGGK